MAILDKYLNHGRQWPLVAVQSFDYSQLTTGTAVVGVKIPDGSRVIGGYIIVDTAWNSATSDVLDIGDGVDDDRYTASQIDLTATGITALSITGYKYPASDTIDLTWTGVGTAPTAGAGVLIVEYIRDGKANEVVPSYD